MSLFSKDLVDQEVSHEAKMEALMDEMWRTLYPKMGDGDIAAWWEGNEIKIVIKKKEINNYD